MPAGSRAPSDQELAQAIHDVRIAALRQRFIADRLLWTATSATLDADTTHLVTVDALVNRGGTQ